MATNNQIIPKRLTRKSSITNLVPYNSGQIPSSIISVKDYTLDKVKSLEKKGNGCMKEHMKYELKQGNNLVIEFSTAAYELAKTCLYEMVKSENFEYAVENRNSLDLSGANVDSCIKIFNKKADGSCGRMLKFYHTTSQILVNGNKTDLFISNILDELCSEMKEKCSQLDILNINISSALSYKPQSTAQITKK